VLWVIIISTGIGIRKVINSFANVGFKNSLAFKLLSLVNLVIKLIDVYCIKIIN
jgi:hypothetical protein